MSQFEYRFLDLNTPPNRRSAADMLNAAGAKGWEVVSVSAINVALLKRTIPDPPATAVAPLPSETAATQAAASYERNIGAMLQEARTTAKSLRPIKYRDPRNPSNTWTGVGRMPLWLSSAIKAGRKKEEFLIKA